MVIVGGGDGSLSTTVDEFLGSETVFAILPLGTANSFARTLGVPLDLDGAIDVIATGRRKRIDLGAIDGDYFANAAAMGLSPLIAETVPHNLKRYLGMFGYLIWALRVAFKFRAFRLHVDDGRKLHKVWATEARIANGSFHGGVELVENAELTSGEIIVQAVTGRSLFGLAWSWFATLFKLRAREQTVTEFHGRELADHGPPGAENLGRRRAFGANPGDGDGRPRRDMGGGAAGGCGGLAEPLQRRAEALRIGRFLGVVGARLFHRFRLGALGESGVGEPRGEAVAVFLGGLGRLRQPHLLSVEVDRFGQRKAMVLHRRQSAPIPAGIESRFAQQARAWPFALSRARAVAISAIDPATTSPDGPRPTMRLERRAPRDVEFGAKSPHLRDQLDQPADRRLRLSDRRSLPAPAIWPRSARRVAHPSPSHSSSVMNGISGWSITSIWSNAQAATALVSVGSNSPFTSSTYQSQKVPQVKW